MTDSAILPPGLQQPGWQMDRFIVATALAGFALLGGLIWLETAPFMAALFVIGTVLGMALYHGAFGFTAGWRNLVVKKRGAGMRAQLMLFGLSSVIMVPMLYSGQAGLVGAVAPVGTSLVVGSFIFGLGMQLGGGCGSGTLFTRRRRQHPHGGYAGVFYSWHCAWLYPSALVG